MVSPLWNGTKGATTWGDGSTGVGGISGVVSSANSLVGSASGDRVGSGGITAFEKGNYVVSSSHWAKDGLTNAGAATWGSGSTGISGAVTTTNSIVGNSADAGLGTIGLNTKANAFVVTFLTESGGKRIGYGYQNFLAPSITSANNTTFTVGQAGSFTITAGGNPTPAICHFLGKLADGISFDDTTGVLSGTPASGSRGTYLLTFRASNGSGSVADQDFILTIV